MPSPASVLFVELVMSIDRLGESARSAVPRAEGWPPHVIVAHVADVDEQVWAPRIDVMVSAYDSGDRPPAFDWWEPDGEATYARHAAVSLDDAVARAMSTRVMMLTRLRELTPGQWSGARARHQVFGEMDMEALIFAVLAHDEEHRASLVLG